MGMSLYSYRDVLVGRKWSVKKLDGFEMSYLKASKETAGTCYKGRHIVIFPNRFPIKYIIGGKTDVQRPQLTWRSSQPRRTECWDWGNARGLQEFADEIDQGGDQFDHGLDELDTRFAHGRPEMKKPAPGQAGAGRKKPPGGGFRFSRDACPP